MAVIKYSLAQMLGWQFRKILAAIRARTAVFAAVCDEPECLMRGPSRPSPEGAISAALATGWRCTHAADPNPTLTCPACLNEQLAKKAAGV